MKKLTEMKK